MATYNRPSLITPPREEEEVYPYRRVWRSIFLETGILLLLMVGFVLAGAFIGLDVPQNIRPVLNIVLASSPALLWLLFSRIPENFAIEPRIRLLTTFTVTALVANAVGLPILNSILQPESWLPQQDTTSRIIGYMLSVGILQEFLKYLVIRLIVWPDYYRVRLDAIAYGVAGAVGYALVLNIDFVLSHPMAAPDTVMIRVFATVTMHIIGSMLVAYGLAETYFSNALSFLLPAMLFLAAAFVGIAIPTRADFLNASLVLTVSTQNTLFGMAFAVASYAGALAVLFFLFSTVEQREQEKLSGQGE